MGAHSFENCYNTISSAPIAQQALPTPAQPVQSANSPKPYSAPQAAEKNAEIAADLYAQGISHTKSRQFEKAATLYQQAITIHPDYAEAHHELGYALFRLRRYAEAITAYQKAIQLRPTFVDTYRNLAQCYVAKGDPANQIAILETAIKLAPKHIEAIHQLAEALFQNKDYEEAGTHFIKVLELNPERAKAWYKLGIVFLKIGEPEKAQEVLEQLHPLDSALAESLATEIIKAGN